MRALALTTRYREDAFEGDACLLVYDEIEVSAAMVSSDVRDVLNARPNTWKIYVAAPFLEEEAVVTAVLERKCVYPRGGQDWCPGGAFKGRSALQSAFPYSREGR